MKLEDIGFYTLNDERAKTSSFDSPLWRCELLLTDRCNFKCPYCRGLNHKGDMSFELASITLRYWIRNRLENVRFSGGEPTLYPHLDDLVLIAKKNGVNHIAISTNGSADLDRYKRLIDYGVNDFSISLDACCASTGNAMAGTDIWAKLIKNIEELSKETYVTVGIVVDNHNIEECEKTIKLVHSLGVSDVRVIPSAQYNMRLNLNISDEILSYHPILKYRINNWRNGRHVRGIAESDNNRCRLVVDDMAVLDNKHYPCIIYLREGGKPIGELNKYTRFDRFLWYKSHDTHNDPICKNNCLDVCIDFNNKEMEC